MAEEGSRDITLDTVASGAAPELFARELQRVLENINDPNTVADKDRKITVTVTFSPSEDRRRLDTSVEVKPTLVPMKPATGIAYMGERNGELVGVNYDPAQGQLFDQDRDPSVHPIQEKQKNGS